MYIVLADVNVQFLVYTCMYMHVCTCTVCALMLFLVLYIMCLLTFGPLLIDLMVALGREGRAWSSDGFFIPMSQHLTTELTLKRERGERGRVERKGGKERERGEREREREEGRGGRERRKGREGGKIGREITTHSVYMIMYVHIHINK